MDKMKAKKYLTSVFASALLTGCISLQQFTENYSYPNYFNRWDLRTKKQNLFTKDHLEIQRDGIEAWTQKKIRLTLPEIYYASEHERKELLRTTPGKSVRVVDLRTPQPEEIKRACYTLMHDRLPLTMQPVTANVGYRSVQINYDINEHGYPVNVKMDEIKFANSFVTSRSISDVIRTKFNPPALNGQKLFCAHANDTFYWRTKGYAGVETTRISNGRHIRSVSTP